MPRDTAGIGESEHCGVEAMNLHPTSFLVPTVSWGIVPPKPPDHRGRFSAAWLSTTTAGPPRTAPGGSVRSAPATSANSSAITWRGPKSHFQEASQRLSHWMAEIRVEQPDAAPYSLGDSTGLHQSLGLAMDCRHRGSNHSSKFGQCVPMRGGLPTSTYAESGRGNVAQQLLGLVLAGEDIVAPLGKFECELDRFTHYSFRVIGHNEVKPQCRTVF